jgi:transposase
MVRKHTNSLLLKNQRRKFSSEFKSRVVIEALTEKLSLNELAEKFDLDANQISDWKKKFLSKAHLVFDLEETEKEIREAEDSTGTNDDLQFT